jgi:hypothetical protein
VNRPEYHLRRLPGLLLALPLLGIACLLPETGFGLWLRLTAATLVLLLPGQLIARALGRRGSPAVISWSVALVGVALGITFAVHGSLTLTLALTLVAGAVALPFSLRAKTEPAPRGRWAVAIGGIALGAALWGIEGAVKGDGIFHLGRVRKLDDLGSLTLRAVDEFKDGGLHPGYAFPLWHGWLALVAKLAGVDPTKVMLHEPSVLAPIALVIIFETGVAVFESSWLGLAALLGQVSLIALAPGGGGAFASIELPGTMARQMLVPAVVGLFFIFVRGPSWPIALTLAAAGLDLALVHPTYALFVAIPLVGFALARLLLMRTDLRASATALGSFTLPVVLVFAWLAPIVAETQSYYPKPSELARALAQYATDLVVSSAHAYHLAAGVVARSGAVAVASLVMVPLAGLAARRRWSAFVLGGTVLVLAVELSSFVFPHFSDLVSLSQSRRAAGFVPFAIAFAGGLAVLARATKWFLLPIAFIAGVVLEVRFPGDFGTKLHHGGPSIATWIALAGGTAALVLAVVFSRKLSGRYESPGPIAALAALLFVLPIAVHGFRHWSTESKKDPYALSSGLVDFLRSGVPKRAIVLSDLQTSYRISAYAPVYVAVAPPVHVADTKANNPYARATALKSFLATGSLATLQKYHPGWVVLRTRRTVPIAHLEASGLRPVYSDRRFIVFKL